MNKLAGVGLLNLIVITMFVWFATVGAKSLAGQNPDNALSKVILAV